MRAFDCLCDILSHRQNSKHVSYSVKPLLYRENGWSTHFARSMHESRQTTGAASRECNHIMDCFDRRGHLQEVFWLSSIPLDFYTKKKKIQSRWSPLLFIKKHVFWYYIFQVTVHTHISLA